MDINPSFEQPSPAEHPWNLLYSGGGLRSAAASSVFNLVLMQTVMPSSSSGEHSNQGKSVYEMFHRQFGVSGGAWALMALTHGNMKDINEKTTIGELCKKLLDTGVVRDGDFEARTKAIHGALLPLLSGKVGEGWSETCCWLPSCCDCFQCCCDCLWWGCCCTCGDKYPLSEMLNETGGEATLAAVAEDPLAALAELVGPIILGKDKKEVELKVFDDDSGALGSVDSRSSFEKTSGVQRYHPEPWLDACTEAAQGKASEYYHLFLRIEGSPKVLLTNPPGDNSHEHGVVNIARDKPIKMKHLLATVGSAFSLDSRSLMERGPKPLRMLHDILPDFPFSSKALVGESTVRKIHIDDPEDKFAKIGGGISRVRDAGVDSNLSFSAVLKSGVVFALDNGDQSEFGQELVISQERGHVGAYTCRYRDAPSGWGIFVKDDASKPGPAYVVYILGLNDHATMNVRKAGDRINRLKQLYEHWTKELPKMVAQVEEMQRMYPAAVAVSGGQPY